MDITVGSVLYPLTANANRASTGMILDPTRFYNISVPHYKG